MDDTQFINDLRTRFDAGERPAYVFFWDHQPEKCSVATACFSQWYDAPFMADGQHYATAEHFMMAEKAALFGDGEIRSQVLAAPDPGMAKRLGRKVRGFDEARWQIGRAHV